MKPLPKPPREDVYDLYIERRLTTRQIARHYSVSTGLVKKWLHFYDIPTRPANRGLISRGLDVPTRPELERLIHTECMGYREIGQIYGIDKGAVMYWVKKLGVQPGTYWNTVSRGTPRPDIERVRQLYEAGASTRGIAAECGCAPDVIRRILIANGVPRRPDGFAGCARQVCKDGHRVRSTYEQRVDDWLTEQGITHVYEPALPPDRRFHADFMANGCYIEIWGVRGSRLYTERKQRKLTLYRAHNLPLIELSVESFHSRSRDAWKRKLRKHLSQSAFVQSHPLFGLVDPNLSA